MFDVEKKSYKSVLHSFSMSILLVILFCGSVFYDILNKAKLRINLLRVGAHAVDFDFAKL